MAPDQTANKMPETKNESNASKDVIRLNMFMAPTTPAQMFHKTGSYAEDPVAYLQQTLGHEIYEKRKHLLSLPEKVDMDRYGNGAHMQHFEQHIAKNVLGKEKGLFFLTGIQAQATALKVHCERAGKNKVAWHTTSHLEMFEEGAYEHLYGLERMLLGSDSEALPTITEINEVLDLPVEDRPAVLLVEIPNRPLGYITYSYEQLEQISAACKAAGVALHMDGARLWEIEPYYQATAGKTFTDLAGLFDSVYVSCYKGLHGVTGAVLTHNDESFMEEAKIWRRRAGGNPFTLTYEVSDCERGYNENIGAFAGRREKMMRIVEGILAATERYEAKDGSRIVSFGEAGATCCEVRTLFNGFTKAEFVKARDAVVEKHGVKVFEWLGSKEETDASSEEGESLRHFTEWALMSVTEKLEDRIFVDGYVALCEELVKDTH